MLDCVQSHSIIQQDMMLTARCTIPTASASRNSNVTMRPLPLLARSGPMRPAMIPWRSPRSQVLRPAMAMMPQFDVDGATSALFTFNMWVVKCGLLFTLFYSTLNWWFYKRAREDFEKENEDNNKKDVKRKDNK